MPALSSLWIVLLLCVATVAGGACAYLAPSPEERALWEAESVERAVARGTAFGSSVADRARFGAWSVECFRERDGSFGACLLRTALAGSGARASVLVSPERGILLAAAPGLAAVTVSRAAPTAPAAEPAAARCGQAASGQRCVLAGAAAQWALEALRRGVPLHVELTLPQGTVQVALAADGFAAAEAAARQERLAPRNLQEVGGGGGSM